MNQRDIALKVDEMALDRRYALAEIAQLGAELPPQIADVAADRPQLVEHQVFDVGVHPVAEDTVDGHDTAIKGAVTDGMKRAFRSFGLQFGNGFYGDQAPRSAPQPERVATQAKANGKPAQPVSNDRNQSQAEMLRRRIFEIAVEQGLDEDQVRTAVVDRTGKSIDDLTAAELGPLVEAAANKLRQMQQAQAA